MSELLLTPALPSAEGTWEQSLAGRWPTGTLCQGRESSAGFLLQLGPGLRAAPAFPGQGRPARKRRSVSESKSNAVPTESVMLLPGGAAHPLGRGVPVPHTSPRPGLLSQVIRGSFTTAC